MTNWREVGERKLQNHRRVNTLLFIVKLYCFTVFLILLQAEPCILWLSVKALINAHSCKHFARNTSHSPQRLSAFCSQPLLTPHTPPQNGFSMVRQPFNIFIGGGNFQAAQRRFAPPARLLARRSLCGQSPAPFPSHQAALHW